jgi:hypothetical protein
MRVVSPAEGDALSIEGQQAVIADGDAMRIVAPMREIVKISPTAPPIKWEIPTFFGHRISRLCGSQGLR